MDTSLFWTINNLVGQCQVLDAIGVFFASGLIWLMVIVLLIGFKERRAPLVAFFAGIFAYVTNYLISLIYFRPRPFVALEEVSQLIAKDAADKAFPSDHTALAFAIAAAVFLTNKKWGIVFLAAAALVALGRVFVGVHYPADILAGAVVGIFFAWLINRYGRKFL